MEYCYDMPNSTTTTNLCTSVRLLVGGRDITHLIILPGKCIGHFRFLDVRRTCSFPFLLFPSVKLYLSSPKLE